ncbi:FKBP-type peptidyl-prolyl cis-trans isomerase [Mucilaginibacter sp. UYCu711]|uniref:FKBP-type peptidyl-prolyl cis-trans isomerase n=1 Tax=Mucilaginibacter sp. UYCu711 TaxID=3156339 RepID=UPI003D238895
MKRKLMCLTLVAIGLASCNGGYKKGDNGLLYNIYTDKSGPKIKEGDFVLANLVIKNDADSVLLSTYDQGRPSPMILPKPQFKGDIFDGVKLLTEGDSASIKLSADTIFKRQPKPPGFKGKFIIYDVKIIKVIPKGTMTDAVFQSTITKYMTDLTTAEKTLEPVKIKNYIADKKLNVTKTDSGLYYVINKPGAGPLTQNGDTVVVNYTGSLLNGKVFDTSVKEEAAKAKLPGLEQRPYAPMRVAVGAKRVIPGMDQSFLLVNKGTKYTIIVPSSLAYGATGGGPIPGYAATRFDLEVIDIIHPKGGTAAPATAAKK